MARDVASLADALLAAADASVRAIATVRMSTLESSTFSDQQELTTAIDALRRLAATEQYIASPIRRE